MAEELSYPRYAHHPREQPRRVETPDEYAALVGEDADWHPWPWSDDDTAAWLAAHPPEGEGEASGAYSPRRRR